MARRMLGGVAAWLVSVLPLAIVNGIAAFGWVDVGVAALVGALTLILGVAFGALTAGWIGGRTPDPSPAEAANTNDDTGYMGARGALWSGGLAGLLYALTMLGVLYAARQANLLPTIILQHPLRMSAAVISVACILAGASLLVGWYAGHRRRAPDDESRSAVAHSTGGARIGQSSQRLAQATPQPRATQRPIPPAPIRQAAPTRPINQPHYDHGSYAEPYAAPPRPTQTPAPATRDRAYADQGAIADWEGLPDLHGPRAGDEVYDEWDERAPVPPPLRRERR